MLSNSWTLSKHTLAVASGSISETADFVSRYLCEPKTRCLSNLGCNNWRAWCVVRSPYESVEWRGSHAFELHWVDAGNFNDIKFENVSELDTFIHYWQDVRPIYQNKIQFFTQNISAWINPLRSAGITIDFYKSLDSNGEKVCHYGITLAGRIYEFLGRCLNKYDHAKYKEWHSCPSAQRLIGTLQELETLDVLDDDTTHNDYFHDARDTNPLIVVGIFAATSNLDQNQALFRHLSIISGANLQENEYYIEDCKSVSITWPFMPNLVVRYVHDLRSPDSYQIQKFDEFVMREHSTFYSEYFDSWDRIMDQHLGLWYSGYHNATCDLLHTILLQDNVSVAARIEPDALELYCGYNGPLVWEYQLEYTRCVGFHLSSFDTECACSPKNSLADFLHTHPNATTCQNCTLGDDDTLPVNCI